MTDVRPSILAADLLNLKQDIDRVAPYIHWLHFDVMDAHFVPNLSFGPSLLKQIKKAYPDMLMDVHLMMDNPAEYISTFVQSGADAITVHAEINDLPSVIRQIRESGIKVGVSLKPATDDSVLLPYLDQLDLILIMTVEPGFGGQKFDNSQLKKARSLRAAGFTKVISVDGGINATNATECVKSGVNAMVMGTAVFGSDHPDQIINACSEL